MFVAHHFIGLDAKPGGQNAIECSGRTASLHVAQFRDPSLNTRAAFDLSRQRLADASQSIMSIDRVALLLTQKGFVGMLPASAATTTEIFALLHKLKMQEDINNRERVESRRTSSL